MATLREHQAVRSRSDLLRLDPNQIKITPGFNVRDMDTSAAQQANEELKASIRANGVQEPIEVHLEGDDIFLDNGHRRLWAVLSLIGEGVEIESIPAIAAPKGTNEAERTLRMVTLNSGLPLTLLEKAEVVRRLLAYGWDRAKIATRMGYSTAQSVANLEKLLEAPEVVREGIRSGEISPSAAVHMVRAHGDQSGEALEQAKATAAERGKSKVTPSSLPRQRKTRTASSAAPSGSTSHLGNQGKFDQALMLLREIIRDGYKIDACATAYLGDLGDLGRVVQWMLDLEEELKDRKKAAQAPASELQLD